MGDKEKAIANAYKELMTCVEFGGNLKFVENNTEACNKMYKKFSDVFTLAREEGRQDELTRITKMFNGYEKSHCCNPMKVIHNSIKESGEI